MAAPNKEKVVSMMQSAAASKSRLMNLALQNKVRVSWAEVDNQLLRDAIVACTDHGAAIMLGRTSDGGALSCIILDGDNKVKQYPNSVESAEELLREVVSYYTEG